jgi:hypothetical protein
MSGHKHKGVSFFQARKGALSLAEGELSHRPDPVYTLNQLVGDETQGCCWLHFFFQWLSLFRTTEGWVKGVFPCIPLAWPQPGVMLTSFRLLEQLPLAAFQLPHLGGFSSSSIEYLVVFILAQVSGSKAGCLGNGGDDLPAHQAQKFLIL